MRIFGISILLAILLSANEYDFSLQKARIERVKNIIQKEQIIIEKVKELNISNPTIDDLIAQGLPESYKKEFNITLNPIDNTLIIRRIDKESQSKQFQKLYEHAIKDKPNYLAISGIESNISLNIIDEKVAKGGLRLVDIKSCPPNIDTNLTWPFSSGEYYIDGTLSFCKKESIIGDQNDTVRLIAHDGNWTVIKSSAINVGTGSGSGVPSEITTYVDTGKSFKELCTWFNSTTSLGNFYFYGLFNKDVNESIKFEKIKNNETNQTEYAKTIAIVGEDNISMYYVAKEQSKLPRNSTIVKTNSIAWILSECNSSTLPNAKYRFNGSSWILF